jgi:hypothetical protein
MQKKVVKDAKERKRWSYIEDTGRGETQQDAKDVKEKRKTGTGGFARVRLDDRRSSTAAGIWPIGALRGL